MDFTKMYTDHYDQLKRTAISFLRNNEDAEDAVQDTFLKFYESLDAYDGTASVATWLTQICINTCKDKLRKRKKENQLIVPVTQGNEHLLDSREDQTTPLETLDAEETELKILSSFSQLPDNLREAAVLKLIDNYSYKQVADTMGIPINTAKTWVLRAKKKLMQPISPR